MLRFSDTENYHEMSCKVSITIGNALAEETLPDPTVGKFCTASCPSPRTHPAQPSLTPLYNIICAHINQISSRQVRGRPGRGVRRVDSVGGRAGGQTH